MKQTQNFLSLGVLCIILGIILLVITSVGIEGIVFFIFPFFFSGSNPISIFLFLIFVIFLLRVMIRTTSDFFGQSDILIGPKCVFCSKVLPVNASFCPSCGNTVDNDTMSNQ